VGNDLVIDDEAGNTIKLIGINNVNVLHANDLCSSDCSAASPSK
jgi:hypothetical protein